MRHLRLYIPVLALGVILLGMVAGGCEILDPNPGPKPITGNPTDTMPPVDNTPATAARGEILYEQHCARCHGEDAEGTSIWRPSIQGRLGIHTIVREGRRAMPAFPRLSDSAIASIELHLRSYPVDFGSKSGSDLFEIFCSGCHGDSGTGSSVFAGNIQGQDSIHDIVRKGRGDMEPVDIPDSIIAKIQGYIGSYQVDLKTVDGRTYYSYICAGCHGAVGEGTTRGWEIRNPVPDYASWVVRNGRPGDPNFRDSMPKYDHNALSEAQLVDMIAWLRGSAKPATGQLLYNRFCASCHGLDGTGNVSEKSVTNKGYDAFYDAIRLGKGGKEYAKRNKYMPFWNAREITDEEIHLMAIYSRSLD